MKDTENTTTGAVAINLKPDLRLADPNGLNAACLGEEEDTELCDACEDCVDDNWGGDDWDAYVSRGTCEQPLPQSEDPFAETDLGWHPCRIIPNPYKLPPLQQKDFRENSVWEEDEYVCLIDGKYGYPIQKGNGVPNNTCPGWARLTGFPICCVWWVEWLPKEGEKADRRDGRCVRDKCHGGVVMCTGFLATQPSVDGAPPETRWKPKNSLYSPWYRKADPEN